MRKLIRVWWDRAADRVTADPDWDTVLARLDTAGVAALVIGIPVASAVFLAAIMPWWFA